jgi:hypothetical protein
MAAERVIQIARIMAFAIEDLFAIVHEQVLKLGHKRQTVQLKGQWVDVDPGGWKKRNKFKICVAFSAGNRDAHLGRLAMLAQKQLETMEAKIPVVTPENLYNTFVELTKAADLNPDAFWTDPRNIPPAPPQPPPEVQKTIIQTEAEKAITAAKLVQQDADSQRKAATDIYAIDANVGLNLLKAAQQHEHEVNLQTITAHHDAAVAQVGAQFAGATDGVKNIGQSLEKTHDTIDQHAQRLGEIGGQMQNVFGQVNKALQLATARKVIKKHPETGEIQGVDLVDHEGKVLAHHRALKDKTGRVIGLET